LRKKNSKFYYLISPALSPLPLPKQKKNTLAQKKQGNGHNKSPHNDSRHEFILKGVLAFRVIVILL
jgi:hypothetical protein